MVRTTIIISSAEFSEDEKYRYWIKRVWDKEKEIGVFIALNPSKATELKSDQTMCNINNLALQWGWGGFYILNLFAFMSTDKQLMYKECNKIDNRNDSTIQKICSEANTIVLAWGEEKPRLVKLQANKIKTILTSLNKEAYCLSKNRRSGYKHPCIIKVEDYKKLESITSNKTLERNK